MGHRQTGPRRCARCAGTPHATEPQCLAGGMPTPAPSWSVTGTTQYPSTQMPPLVALALQAMNEAVAGVIIEHRRTGRPLALWQDGRTALVAPDSVPLPDTTASSSVHEGR